MSSALRSLGRVDGAAIDASKAGTKTSSIGSSAKTAGTVAAGGIAGVIGLDMIFGNESSSNGGGGGSGGSTADKLASKIGNTLSGPFSSILYYMIIGYLIWVIFSKLSGPSSSNRH